MSMQPQKQISKRLMGKLVKTAHTLIHLPNSSKKHFTFIVRRNAVMAIGWNDGFRTHPLAARYGHRYEGIHSELMAILQFRYSLAELQAYEVVNVRIKSDMGLGNAKPCSCCTRLLKDFGIQNVWHSNDDGQMERIAL